jgi:hypothetical protein
MNMTPEQIKNWRKVMMLPDSITDEEVQKLRDNTQDKINELRDFEGSITCPYCEAVQDTETEYGHTTINGTDGKGNECDCDHCGKTFLVEEMVSRSWMTIKSS